MGFTVQPRTAAIDFEEGHTYHGLEAEVSLEAPMDLYQRIARISLAAETLDAKSALSTLDGFLAAVTEFGDEVLVEWNLEAPPGVPVPATGAALVHQSRGLVQAILGAWMSASGEVSAPLVEQSAAGPTSAAPSIPELASLSPSLSS